MSIMSFYKANWKKRYARHPEEGKGLAYKLNKAICGLKQSHKHDIKSSMILQRRLNILNVIWVTSFPL